MSSSPVVTAIVGIDNITHHDVEVYTTCTAGGDVHIAIAKVQPKRSLDVSQRIFRTCGAASVGPIHCTTCVKCSL